MFLPISYDYDLVECGVLKTILWFGLDKQFPLVRPEVVLSDNVFTIQWKQCVCSSVDKSHFTGLINPGALMNFIGAGYLLSLIIYLKVKHRGIFA